MSAGQLLTELGLNIVQAALPAILLSLATGVTGFAARIGFVTLVGVLAAITTNVEYWNWYGFPGNYTVAYIADKIIGFLVVELVVAALVRKSWAMPALVTTRAA